MRDPVKFLQTTSDKLDSLPVENGRLVVLKDTPGLYYEVDEKRYSSFSGADYVQNDETAPDYIKNRPFYETPEVWNKAELIDDTWNDRATCKLASKSVEWAENNSYRLRIDEVEYTFNGMVTRQPSASTDNQNVYYIGATYVPRNSNMDFSEYLFCLLTTDFENIYAVFEDATLNHIVEFFERGTIHQLDGKYIKDMYYTGDPIETFIVEETTITLEEGGDPIGIINSSQPLEAGKEYIITINNTKYNAVCKKHSGMGLSYLGNLSIIGQGPDTEEPFFTGPMDSDTELGFIFASDTLEYTVSISTIAPEIHYLDSKYIKDMYYKEINEVEVLPQSSLLFGYATFDDVLLPSSLIEGSSYTVNWNGTEYECVARTGKWGTCIENTEVPFYIETVLDGDVYTYIETANTGSHTISIYNNTDSVEVLPETSVELNDYIVERFNELSEMLVEGSEYTVNWNDIEYKCIAKSNGDDVYIGNTTLNGHDSSESDEPFFVLTFAPDNYSLIIPLEEGTHDIHITGKVKTIHKIDREYLSGLIGMSSTGENSEIFNDYRNNIASGNYSHAEGWHTTSSGYASHSEGEHTTASGESSHTEGYNTTASGSRSHAEGWHTTASGYYSHAEGNDTIASGESSHAEGQETTASGSRSHAEGFATTASGTYSHAEGFGTVISLSLTGNANTTTYTVSSNNTNIKAGRILEYNNTYAEITSYDSSTLTITIDKTLDSSNALSDTTVNLVLGIASGYYSHAEGLRTTASGAYSHTEGNGTIASGVSSHAEGNNTTASDDYSHAEGNRTIASGDCSHAEGNSTIASGGHSHSEGYYSTASGAVSHAEGSGTIAFGHRSHAEGRDTIASGENQHVQGRYNINDVDAEGNALNTYAHIIGNGTSDTARSNAHTIDWSGNGWFAGSVEATALILLSPNGTRFNITVGDDGVLSASEITTT